MTALSDVSFFDELGESAVDCVGVSHVERFFEESEDVLTVKGEVTVVRSRSEKGERRV